MKPSTHRLLLIFITLAILTTIALQVHWNVKNYEENKQRTINDIQIAFDKGVDNYYTDEARRNLVVLASDSAMVKTYSKIRVIDSIENTPTFKKRHAKEIDTIRIIRRPKESFPPLQELPKKLLDQHTKLKMRAFRDLSSKMMTALYRDSVDFKKLDLAVSKELKRKDIALEYDFVFKEFRGKKHYYGKDPKIEKPYSMHSSSAFLVMNDEQLTLQYASPTSQILQRGMTEIILSFVFSLIVIGCLLYLLHIINRQKKVEEIRNDLISNITHEFKTPITTVVAALEGIRSFNETDDKEKTARYLDISERQMAKLQTMVEKLLETATLETDEIKLKREQIDIVPLLHSIVEKYQLYAGSKVQMTADPTRQILINGDTFHLENALSNLIDNAIKYGGDLTNIRVVENQHSIEIFVEDNGGGIHGWHRDRIFEKFYRIPTGNVHNVKGFGIGLFYAKKIIEKHDGHLELIPNEQWTIFKITLPYA